MKRYFVTNIHRASDAKAMERAIVEFAELELADCLVHEERIHTIVERLKWFQSETLRSRPRLSTVEIQDCGDSEFVNGHRAITIGTSQINMTAVKAEIE